ncbi:hypothetical protein HK097_001953 [Rhizophlyctis rosea]|uniref:glutathione transferase n=1 Tax=Rhizophlyctis rosea TaxID=64517 RepID=A0AAD5X1K0_9FUNG|nr:hypothetical protein HK097_001953 [Rhizophlyctis rosea]
MPLTIHGLAQSTCTQRVLTTLKELNVSDYKLRIVDWGAAEHKSPAFLKMQPFGKIPVLEDSDLPGVYIFESRAIIRYIVRKYSPTSSLLGSTPAAQALVETWISVESANFNPSAEGLAVQLVFGKFRGVEPDQAAVENHLKQLGATLDVYDKHLADKKFLVGEDFTLADIVHYPYLNLAVTSCGHPEVVNDRPNVKAWWERMSSRPAWKQVLAEGSF